ncbi:unnamed protein product [Didymodactylos carnosus]|uniref:Uncharacterized protein n=1 Tax=Didymodactylos carnosus TaxID=1234261 RepID=A0A813VNQ0_9BILA|nr:unnamed protein product [Didymodactylos carnosus]CAF0843305.1 unnamed protein product [Didymodactylos carnosus]CAF3580862.1 unnamed protein product [Didymodactylos carnosus]CAF3630693.1 unnamed protein product [Didymodactylos carnosus]
MYSGAPIYTTKHYIHEPRFPAAYQQPRGIASSTHYTPSMVNQNHQPYSNSYSQLQPPTTVTYMNDPTPRPMPNYNQSYNSANSYQPSDIFQQPNNQMQQPVLTARSGNKFGNGNIEKTNMMSSQSPFFDPARSYEQTNNYSRTSSSITAQPKSGGSVNKTLNLSSENPFHDVYGGYQYSARIDPTKRITSQSTAVRSTDNKSLNLSDENPFFSIYGGYHYPSQIDPSKRITELPKQAGQLEKTNDLSSENPFSNYRPVNRNYNSASIPSSSFQNATPDWNRNNLISNRSYDSNNNMPRYGSYTETNPPDSYRSPPPDSFTPKRTVPDTTMYKTESPLPNERRLPQPVKPKDAPADKNSLNMSPENPFAATYGQHYYPSNDEIKAQKRQERNVRFADESNQRASSVAAPPQQQQKSMMSEYPEEESKDIIQGKGKTKFTRFDVNF